MSNNEILIERLLPLKPAVLLFLLTLGEDRHHGYAIMVGVRERSDGLIDLGTSHLYRHLKAAVGLGHGGGDRRQCPVLL